MMDIQEIQQLLPHRYPFLLVDRVVEIVPGQKLVAFKNVTMNEEFKPSSPEIEPAQAVISGTSATEAAELLFQLLIEVVQRHQPEIEPVLRGGANIVGLTPELMARALQAQGIWFQLIAIAEQNAAMRRRRQIERTRGREALRGTFAHVLAEAASG